VNKSLWAHALALDVNGKEVNGKEVNGKEVDQGIARKAQQEPQDGGNGNGSSGGAL